MQREKKQTGESSRGREELSTVAVNYCLLLSKAALTENHKAHFKKWKLLKFELLRLQATHSLASFLPLAIVICCWAKGAWFYILAWNYAHTSTETLFSSSANISPNSLKTWFNLNCFITRKKSDVQSSAAEYVSRSISSKEFGFRDRGDRSIRGNNCRIKSGRSYRSCGRGEGNHLMAIFLQLSASD